MEQPKYKVDQQVKYMHDHDRLTGKVKEIKWNSTDGFTYNVSSRYFDKDINDMREGVIICNEDELVDMTDYVAPTAADPVLPDQQKEVTDTVEAAPTTTEGGQDGTA